MEKGDTPMANLSSPNRFGTVKISYSKIDAFIRRITRVFSSVAGGAVLSLFLLVLVNVFLRAIFNSPFKHTDEIVRFNMAWIVYFGFAYTLRIGRHIAIDALTSHFSEELRKKVNKVSVILVSVWIMMISYGGWKLWLDLFRKGQRSFGLLEVELWIPGLCIILGLSWFSAEGLNEVVKTFLGMTDKKPEAET